MCAPPTSVPSPAVTITGSPINVGFHTGVLVTFTGRAEFNPAVDTPLTVEGVWSKTDPPSDLSADERVTIGAVVMVGGNPMVFESNLTINRLKEDEDSGTYTIFFNISTTQPNIVGIAISEQRRIMVTSRSCDNVQDTC